MTAILSDDFLSPQHTASRCRLARTPVYKAAKEPNKIMKSIFILLVLLPTLGNAQSYYRFEHSQIPTHPLVFEVTGFKRLADHNAVNIAGVIYDSVMHSSDTVLIGASISTLSAKSTTTTDIDGLFQLDNVALNDTIVVTNIGYMTKLIPAAKILNSDTTKRKAF